MLNTAISIIIKLQSNGYVAVFAGGCVRDMLLGVEPKDYDIATSAKPEQIEQLFDHTIPIGKSFGVITIIANNYQFEVATFRRDGVYEDNRHPSTIEFCDNMIEDAKRRDFTINGMFYDPLTNMLYDYVGGQADLENHIIRFIGNANDRIQEDKLRMLRAIRFAVKLNFRIYSDDFEVIRSNAIFIKTVSIERTSDELVKIFRCSNIRRAIDLLIKTDLLQIVLPEIYQLKNCEQDKIYHPEGHTLEHTIRLIENIKFPPEHHNNINIIIWAGLFHDVGKPFTFMKDENGRIRNYGHDLYGEKITKTVLQRLKFSNEFIENVCGIVGDHMHIKQINKMKKSTVKKYACKPYINELLIVSQADSMASGLGYEHNNLIEIFNHKINEYGRANIKPNRLLTGNDLKIMGYKPDPIFAIILNEVYDLQLNDQIQTKEQAINYVKEHWVV
jgi:tRNA nucleotidyltransferase/poly(A) polymerase